MSERVISKRKVLAGMAMAFGVLATNGCGIGDARENTFNIGVTCPDNTDLNVIGIQNNSSGNDEVTLNCTSEEATSVAPSDIQLLSGSAGVVVGDQEITDTLKVITKTYGGGRGTFGNSQIDTESGVATLSFSVARIEEASVNSNPGASQSTTTAG